MLAREWAVLRRKGNKLANFTTKEGTLELVELDTYRKSGLQRR